MTCSSAASSQMDGFAQLNSSSSKEKLSSYMLENEQAAKSAVASGNIICGLENAANPLSWPVDSQFLHATSALSAYSFRGGFHLSGINTTTGGHQFNKEARMMNDSPGANGSGNGLFQHRQVGSCHIPPPVWTNDGISPYELQQSMLPTHGSGFQQNACSNLATEYDTSQIGGASLLSGSRDDSANMQGNRDGGLDLNDLASQSNSNSMPVPDLAIADYGHSNIQPLGHQLADCSSGRQNMVISNSNSSNCSGNFDRRFMVLQSGMAAKGCSMPIPGSHGTANHRLWSHGVMDISCPGQHTPGGMASPANNLDGLSQLNYDAAASKYMLLNNIQRKNLSDQSQFLRTASRVLMDSGNVKSGIAVTPLCQSPLSSQLQSGIYPQAWFNQKLCLSSPMYHQRTQVALPASKRQSTQIDGNFSKSSLATAFSTGSIFPGRTGAACEGTASMSSDASIQKSDASLVSTHKRKLDSPSGMGGVVCWRTQRDSGAVNFSPARFATSAMDQCQASAQISQLAPCYAPSPGSVSISMPKPKGAGLVSPQFQSVMSRSMTPVYVRQRVSSVRRPMIQEQIMTPLSSTCRPPIGPSHLSVPANTPQWNQNPSIHKTARPVKLSPCVVPSKSKRPKISPVIRLEKLQGEEKAYLPLGYECNICKRDVSYAPEGPTTVLTAPQSVAVLPCGHTFHDKCLQARTPKEQEKHPPCILCAIGDGRMHSL